MIGTGTNPFNLIAISEVSLWLGVSTKTVYGWIHTRQIPFVKVGRLVKFQTNDISAWVEGKKVPIIER